MTGSIFITKRDSQLPTKGAVLEGGEERVQLRQRRALRRFQPLHRRHPPGEFALRGDGGKWERERPKVAEW